MKCHYFLLLILALAFLTACVRQGVNNPTSSSQTSFPSEKDAGISQSQEEEEMTSIQLTIDGQEVSVDWEDNSSMRELTKHLSQEDLSLTLSEYGGVEQVGSLGMTLPNEDRRQRAQAGDIMLYTSNNLVIFYGPNTWSYTKLGHITGNLDLEKLLHKKQVTVTLSLDD